MAIFASVRLQARLCDVDGDAAPASLLAWRVELGGKALSALTDTAVGFAPLSAWADTAVGYATVCMGGTTGLFALE